MNVLAQTMLINEQNNIIRRNLLKSLPNVGRIEGTLSEDMIKNMDTTVEELCKELHNLNDMFKEKQITANSEGDYALFLLRLSIDMITMPDLSEVNSLSKNEVEALVIAQVSMTSHEEMRWALIDNAMTNEKTGKSLHEVRDEYNLLDDATIADAYKTLLHKQYNVALQTVTEQEQTNG